MIYRFLTRPITLIFLLLIAGCSQDQPATGVLPSEAKGKIALVNYWAEWCKPCREEISELNKLATQRAGEVLVYGVNFDGVTGEELTAVEKRMGVQFPTLAKDPGPALGLSPPNVLPVTLILGEDGTLLDKLVGEQTLESLEKRISQVNAK
jgi:Thiol-disulfide isomerase and thioredoxins